ncbi:uncharacterized protein LOC142254233 [Anomaloglossus baeobatrachus]|uniref:uncharacterized protein LOC142254233 n=3 Tax=Anomaloglossus baeobatrachus TaxID=238106 RepID=UPI003F4F9A26
MESLLQEFMKRASEDGGEAWLKQCLAVPRRPAEAEEEMDGDAAVIQLTAPEEMAELTEEIPARRRSQRRSSFLPPTSSSREEGNAGAELSPPILSAGTSARHPPAPGHVSRKRKSGSSSQRRRKSAALTQGFENPSRSRAAPASVSVPEAGRATGAPWSDSPSEEDDLPAGVREQDHQRGSAAEAGIPEEGRGSQSRRRGPIVIWIVGHSYIFWAKRRASGRSYGENLAINIEHFNILWYSVRGMRWDGLMKEMSCLKTLWPSPNLIILHLGGNDIGKVKTLDLIAAMRRDLSIIRSWFPDAGLVFSEIVPRLQWHCDRLRFRERIRKRVNRAMERFLPVINGSTYRHLDLEGFLSGLYRDDLVHLSDVGLDIFNLGLQNCIEKWL